MAPKFGTSGLRGLVTELTDPLVAGHVRAFLGIADRRAGAGTVLIGRDLRASSPHIAAVVAGAVQAAGLRPLDCGVLPTPALALAAQTRATAAVMVTGSHIPDDRNGLKFYTSAGEITKADEAAIRTGYAPLDTFPAEAEADSAAQDAYRARYRDGFGPDALAGLRLGVFEHSSAARDILGAILDDLGAQVVPFGRQDRFVPVDTEALDPAMTARLAGWAADHGLDAIVSTDGDADRPMVADAAGRVIPGDRLGPLTADWLGADCVVTPISSNTLVEAMDRFEVIRTRIGSPFVIAGMAAATTDARPRVAGYEANGGFLLGFRAGPDGRALTPLPTRDAVLPIVAVLAAARARGLSLADLDATLPRRFTATDRLTGIATERAAGLIAALDRDEMLRTRLLGPAPPVAIDRLDGWRATLAGGRIVHLRPSGNAPELRVHTEAADAAEATALRDALLRKVAACLGAEPDT